MRGEQGSAEEDERDSGAVVRGTHGRVGMVEGSLAHCRGSAVEGQRESGGEETFATL